MNRPLCRCHGVPMYLRKDRGWRCRIKQLEANHRYYQRHREEAKAKVTRYKMETLGRYGSWMNVLRITKVSEVEDGT